MCEPNWEALAEVYIKPSKTVVTADHIFCLCTRAHIKVPTEVLTTELEELSESYDVFNENDCDNLTSNMNRIAKDLSQEEEDSDANSCYYSASVSHTDNYCTTDEHERDSGADTSEFHGPGAGCKENSKRCNQKESKCQQERNRSLPDIFGDEEKNLSWEKYWSENGEQLIWSSWIAKYSDFINPAYKSPVTVAGPSASTDDQLSMCTDEERLNTVVERREIETEIIVSSCSPADLGDSEDNAVDVHDDTTNSDYQIRDLMDSLLIPRCDSVSSSIPLTIGTTDSMTNVTQISLSSYGFCSSHVSSENSQLSESTPPSSVSTPSNVDGDETKIELFQNDDSDQHWQSLWQSHFQEEYTKHYHDFISKQEDSKQILSTSLKDSEDGFFLDASHRKGKFSDEHSDDTLSNTVAQPYRKKHPEVVEADIDWSNDEDNQELSTMGLPTSFGRKKSGSNDEDTQALAAMGLPTSFGRKKSGTAKSHGPKENEDSNQNYVKSAFALMGYSFMNDNEDAITEGHAVYRKRNIRLHNSFLKMKSRKLNENQMPREDPSYIKLIKTEAGYSSSDETDSSPITVAAKTENTINTVNTINTINTIPPNQLTEDENAIKPKIEREESIDEEIPVTIKKELPEVPSSDVSPIKMSNKKSKKKRRQNKTLDAMPSEIRSDKSLYKYWCKRFSLFSLFDKGIKLDRESWFSVTPEKVAAYTAERCKCDLIIDAFCGAGGNTIQFAKTCRKVIAIDIDPKKIEMAKHNASIYGVLDRIEFIVGDFFALASSLKADVVFLSPPWGGPEYLKNDIYDIELALQPKPASDLMKITRQITNNIAIYLPRNSNTHQLVMLAGPGNSLELEQGFLDRKLIAITAFYGNLLKNTQK